MKDHLSIRNNFCIVAHDQDYCGTRVHAIDKTNLAIVQ